MTREEAIEALSVLKIYDAPWLREAIDMAIEALKELQMREQYNLNYETDDSVKFGVTNKNKDKVILYDAFGEKEYYPQQTTIPMFKESEEAYKAWTGEEMGGGRLIDADALLELINKIRREYNGKDDMNIVACGVAKRCIRAIDSMPTVSADRPHGEWILVCDGGGECDNLYRCSHCGQEVGCEEYDKPKFCGECGADMRGEDNVK